MWICLNQAFLSIVASDQDPAVLMVRARRAGDIEAVFSDQFEVVSIPGRDYAFRAFIPRANVARVIGEHLARIDYPNFKNSVRDPHLHKAYANIWRVMADLQGTAPYETTPRVNFHKHPVR